MVIKTEKMIRNHIIKLRPKVIHQAINVVNKMLNKMLNTGEDSYNMPTFKNLNLTRALITLITSALLSISLTACSSMGRVDRHGHILTSDDLANVKQGMSKDQVIMALGTPDTQSTMENSVFYYISTKTRTVSLMKPTTFDRKVVAVYFDQGQRVRKLANYGLKDGKIFDYISRKTPSHGGDYTFLQQMFGNLGKGPIMQ